MAKEKAPQGSEENQEKASKGKWKWIILILLLLGLLGAGGYFAYTFLYSSDNPGASESGNATQSREAADSGPEKVGSKMVSLPTLLVNLADPLGKRYLKISVDVEVKGKEASSQIQSDMPKIKDALILLLSSKTFEDLSSMESKYQLKKEIVERLNQILGQSVVRRVYFTEFIIQ